MTSTTREEGSDHPSHLDPSELGTKEYWESFYDDALEYLSSKRTGESHEDNHDEDDEEEDDDPGTSWFSEYKAPEKVLRFLTSPSFPLAPCNTSSSSSSSSSLQPSILDLGTGNGSMLTLLRDEGGFRGPMVGVDYSPKSIELARVLLQRATAQSTMDTRGIRFETWDILAETTTLKEEEEEEEEGGVMRRNRRRRWWWPNWFPAQKGGFDIVLDKGTFDAVSLSAEEVEEGDEDEGRRRICERYPAAAIQLVRRGGFLVVTSCNWTEEELVKWFTTSEGGGGGGDDGLVVWDRIKYATFRFGGQEGQGVCTVCFQRKGGG